MKRGRAGVAALLSAALLVTAVPVAANAAPDKPAKPANVKPEKPTKPEKPAKPEKLAKPEKPAKPTNPGLNPPAAGDRPWMNTALSAEQRARLVVEAATLDEKITIVSGAGPNQRYDRNGVPRLNVPAISSIDSALGIQSSNVQGAGVTQFPTSLSLASTFDSDLAQRQGAGVGREAFELGNNELLGPNFDLARVPWSGRLYEGYGEDPLLVGELGSSTIAGIQSNPVTSVAKHYNVNTQETRRADLTETVSERAIREVYTPPWQKGVNKGLAGVMCAFNRINTDWACENTYLLSDVLKGDLGFPGYVITDYNANHSTVASANAGLDNEGPNTTYWGNGQLVAAIQSGQVPMSRLDDMVFRLVQQYFKLGLVDNPARGLNENLTDINPPLGPVDTATLASNAAIAQEIGEEGSVLLKNDGILPLDRNVIDSVAVIGAGAKQNNRGGLGVDKAASFTSILDGITASAGVPVEFAAGNEPFGTGDMLAGPAPVPASALSSEGSVGLKAEYYAGVGFNGTPSVVRNDRTVNFLSGLANILGSAGAREAANLPPQFFAIGGPWSARWTGTITAPTTGTYTLSTSYQLGSTRLVVDGQEVVTGAVTGTENSVATGSIALTAGQSVPVVLEFQSAPQTFIGTTRPAIRLGWDMPEGALTAEMQEAVDVAKRNDVAVVVVRDTNTEAADRGSLTLPQDQDRLVRAVTAANPRTVVVSATGAPALMPWRDEVPAILQAWYAGQEQGKAVASLLFGDANPSGKLPVSFPAGEREHPINTVEQWPGVNNVVTHTEGGFIGYRGYDKYGFTPAFAFGHGLSYTSFDYSRLNTFQYNTRSTQGPRVKLDVANTGATAGTEIVQVYVGKLPGGGDMPDKRLAGWARVENLPAGGQQKNVDITLDPQAFSYWDEITHAWVTPKGQVEIFVGSSSDDIRLTGTINVK